MSPSLHDAIRLALCPDGLLFARYGRGLRPRLLGHGFLHAEAGGSDEPWRAPLECLPRLIEEHAPRRSDATVILSNHFVRYALLEAKEALTDHREWQAYAAHWFEKTYGAAARDWEIRVTASPQGNGRLASAIDKTLLIAITDAFRAGKARLRSIQPHLMAAFNRALRDDLPSAFWFALEEPGRLSLGLVRNGLWQSVRSRRAGARWHEEVVPWIERERALSAPDESPLDVLVSSLDPEEVAPADDYRITSSTTAPVGKDRRYAMVYA